MSAIELHAHPSSDYVIKLAEAQNVLAQAAAQYGSGNGASASIVQASSLGAEDMVISHLINSLQLDIGIFVLDTGVLHQQTLDLLERFRASSRATVTPYAPMQQAVVQFVEREGKDAMYKSVALRKSCCGIRKMEPLERALAGKEAWVTGLRRAQSGARAEVPLVDMSESRTKINPLASWTWGDVWHTIRENQLDYNPLHDAFFPSIGCEPCTRSVTLGEDFRSGRWWWEHNLEGGADKECGLHVKASNPIQEIAP